MHSHYAHPSFKQVQNKCKKKNKATHPLRIRSTELGCEELPQSPFKHCLLPGLVIFWVTCISTSLLCNSCFSMHYSQIYCPITNGPMKTQTYCNGSGLDPKTHREVSNGFSSRDQQAGRKHRRYTASRKSSQASRNSAAGPVTGEGETLRVLEEKKPIGVMAGDSCSSAEPETGSQESGRTQTELCWIKTEKSFRGEMRDSLS